MTHSTPRRRLTLSRTLPFWLLLPGLIVIAAVQLYPALFTFYLGFQRIEPGTGQYVFRGLDNFARLFGNSSFIESIGHTVVFLFGYCVLAMVFAIGIALLLRQRLRLNAFAITVIFIPWVLSDVIVGVVWRLFVVPDYGLFSPFFAQRGISVLTSPPPPTLVEGITFPPAPAMFFLIFAAVWKVLPFITLLILAALQTVPNEVLESASIDGATGAQSLRHITFPLILPVLAIALINLILGGINGVGMVFSLTSGGPGTATEVLSYLLYSIGFARLDFGLAASLSVVMTIINLVLVLLTLRFTSPAEEQ